MRNLRFLISNSTFSTSFNDLQSVDEIDEELTKRQNVPRGHGIKSLTER